MSAININDVLGEQQRRLAEIDAIHARIHPALDRLETEGSEEQIALFAAAGIERGINVLLWKTSEEGRLDEADAYAKALEQLWGNPVEGEPITAEDIERMHELATFDEPINRDPLYKAGGFATSTVFALRAALASSAKARAVSNDLWGFASLLGTRTETRQEDAEIDRQVTDIDLLLRDGATELTKATLRSRSRQVGRAWLDLIVDYARS